VIFNFYRERQGGAGMTKAIPIAVVRRRAVLHGAGSATLGFAGTTFAAYPSRDALAEAADADAELVKRLIGRTPTESSRVHLKMPPIFSNGYTVPLILEVESPMTQADYVRLVHVLAPRNPIVLVASFHFTPQSGEARVSTRIRLAEPQNVIAAAQMSDGTTLMARTWVKVDTNGCA
jgi:sulfur-oxidizing protein SoxY